MTNIKGIGASSGIALAKAYKLEMPDLTVSRDTITDPAAEIARFNDNVAEVKVELAAIKEAAARNMSEEEAAIFDAHAQILEDPEIASQVSDKINNDKLNAAAALEDVANQFIAIFSMMEDEYFKERAADVRDVSTRLKAHLLGKKLPNPALIDEEVVICANDLTPSDTAQLNSFVKGFITNIGGRTSHSAIMARSREIPAVVATNVIMDSVNDGDFVIMDGTTGEVILNPDDATIAEYQKKKEEFDAYKAELKTLVDAESVSTDGHKVLLVANIGSPNDIEPLNENGAEGVGLYRTEFLYMESDTLPTEDEQFNAYKTVLENVNGPVVVRTLDIGGDKQIKAMELPKDEMNPFLGVRAIRLCFQHEDIFRTQLRALLRASVYGDLHIMFPMIATLDEFRKAKGILMEEKEKLVADGVKVADKIEVGIMIEIPAAAVLADQFAKEVDFFSIGTNDLIQYTFAADRMSSTINYLYQPFNPSIIRLVANVIKASHDEGKWTGMCGEMAGEALAAPILLGAGLDEFSMSATSVLAQRKRIRALSYAECQDLVADIIANKKTMPEVTEAITAATGIEG